MMDISMGKDEKAYYITNVKMKDDGEHFIVFYADGHTVEHEFSAHNFNVYIYRMKHQILDNRWTYVATQNFIASMAVVKEFRTLMLSITGLFITSSIPMPAVLKAIITIIVVLYNVGYTFKRILEILDAYIKLGKYKSLEDFVNIMEDFRIDIIDPVTGHEEDWYLVNIGDIEPDTNIENLKLKAMTLTPEIKKEEGKRISELIKERFPKRLTKSPKPVKN